MSDDEKAIFDKGRAGIGHNQRPALDDDQAETPPDIDNAPIAGPRRGLALSDTDKAQLKEWEKSGQLEKVKQVSDFGSDTLESECGSR